MQGDSTPATVRTRRTQQERRETTRTALMRATVECLVELGYSATTTLEVERRAGVSRGARIHHFPTKALLLASACDHLYGELADHYDLAFGQADPGATDAERLSSGLRVLWSVYKRPGHVAVLELSVAARTDAELRARLQEVALRHRRLAVEAASKYFPIVPSALAERLVLFIHSALVGLLVERNVLDEEARDEAVVSQLEAAVAAHLSALQASHPVGE
jgi:AcrR family transcriptional regulator